MKPGVYYHHPTIAWRVQPHTEYTRTVREAKRTQTGAALRSMQCSNSLPTGPKADPPRDSEGRSVRASICPDVFLPGFESPGTGSRGWKWNDKPGANFDPRT